MCLQQTNIIQVIQSVTELDPQTLEVASSPLQKGSLFLHPWKGHERKIARYMIS